MQKVKNHEVLHFHETFGYELKFWDELFCGVSTRARPNITMFIRSVNTEMSVE